MAGDAGGARALAPVIRALRALPSVTVELRAYRAALDVWRSERLAAQPITSDDPTGFDRVLLATSFVRERWEMRVARRARACGIPSLVMVDFWSQYRDRFTVPDGSLIVPDRIAVADEAMRRELVQAGFPEQRLVVTGQPALESLHAYRSRDHRQAARAAVREHSRPPYSRLHVVFVSQPLSLQYSVDELGYHEDQVLAETVAALGGLLDGSGRYATLLVKTHPRDVLADIQRAVPRAYSARLAVRILDSSELDIRRLMLGSDLVVGMHSTALIEACVLGRPVVSYQPRLRIRDPLPSNRLGWSRAVYAAADLRGAIGDELFNTRTRRSRLARLRRIDLPGGAAAHIAAEVVDNRVARD